MQKYLVEEEKKMAYASLWPKQNYNNNGAGPYFFYI